MDPKPGQPLLKVGDCIQEAHVHGSTDARDGQPARRGNSLSSPALAGATNMRLVDSGVFIHVFSILGSRSKFNTCIGILAARSISRPPP